MTGGGDPDPWEDKFHFSFYELNNGEIIELHLHENFQGGKLDFTDYSCSYTKQELKSGEIRNYTFGNAKANDENEMSKEFFEWFHFFPNHKDVIDSFAIYYCEGSICLIIGISSSFNSAISKPRK